MIVGDTANVATSDCTDPGVLTYRQAADLLGCEENTIRTRVEKQRRYRKVPGSTRPARVYAQEIVEERAALLRRLKARELTDAAVAPSIPQSSDDAQQRLIDQIAHLQGELAAAVEVARVLLISDTSKNELLRQYLYENKDW